ncbi:MAG: HAMP domain-containing histidine kinase [Clostridiales bacterium]|nr:HAMP domain-containing histidine kinase [Clostridiales bacterium]
MKKPISGISEKNKIRAFFVFGVAVILLCAIVMVAILEYLMIETQKYASFTIEETPFLWVLMFAGISLILGLALTFIFGKIITRPFNLLIDGITKLAEGEFNTRLNLGRAGKIVGVKSLEDKFNALASELQKTEILRSDFVNNFSHELKTPIVSVSSLIGLMKNDDISKEKRLQYLNVIEEEISRLTDMTTNILNLSKIENQGILTDKTEFNVAEQIRTCVLLLEKKWTKKQLELNMEFDEFQIRANEDLLKQVWFNLIDNAVKFSNDGGELKIEVEKIGEDIAVTIENTGETIDESEYTNIFQKFYQGNKSHKKEGNGIGLSIVKHIVDLHGGEITVKSENGRTRFFVILPS